MHGRVTVRRSEVLAALSHATDLATGQPFGHGLRRGLLATGLAQRLGADLNTVHDAFELALVWDLGCTSAAHELGQWFEDEIAAHQRLATLDLGSPGEVLRDLLRHGRGRSVLRAASHGSRAMHDLMASTCEVATRLGGRLGIRPRVLDGLAHGFARWDGRGWPADARGDSMSICARIVHVAHDTTVFHRMGGRDAAVDVVERRSGAAYDPSVARTFLAHAGPLLAATEQLSLWDAALEAEPAANPGPWAGQEIDQALEAVGDFADLKSPWTAGHSRAVARLAAEAAIAADFEDAAALTVRRAALVRDLGRVGVPNRVLDKPGPLDEAEWEQVRLRSDLTGRILARPDLLRHLGPLAVPQAVTSPSAALLAAANAYVALASDRPHRARLEPAAAARFVQAEARSGRLDADAVAAVLAAAGGRPPPTSRPASLADGDLDVLRLAVRGLSHQQVAGKVAITEATARSRAEHLFRSLGVRSRPALALAAAEHELLPFNR